MISAPENDRALAPDNLSAHDSMHEKGDVLPVLLDIGAAMLVAGGDVNLVERCIARMGYAYGAESMNTFVITSLLTATMTLPDGREVTRTRRVDTTGETNFDKLEKLNRLCTECCKRPLPISTLKQRLSALKAETLPRPALYLGGVLAAGSFAVFFGGSLLDGAVSAAFAVLICFMIERIKPFAPNNIVFNFAASLITGMGIGLSARLIPGISADMVMIGDIMLLIPGIAMTNSARDMLAGDTLTGMMRLVESLLWATSLALGFMVSMWAIGVS